MAKLYAQRYPDVVAGLVMVDAGSEFVRRVSPPDSFACWDRFHQKPALPEGEGIKAAEATDAILMKLKQR